MIKHAVCFMLMSSAAIAAPNLSQTDVYTSHKDCTVVDLSNWQHPTKQVLMESKVRLRALQMCGQYPIFHVSAQYAPMLHATDTFYLPFFAKMWVANGKNPLAIDIMNWHDVVELSKQGAGLAESDEQYGKPGPADAIASGEWHHG